MEVLISLKSPQKADLLEQRLSEVSNPDSARQVSLLLSYFDEKEEEIIYLNSEVP